MGSGSVAMDVLLKPYEKIPLTPLMTVVGAESYLLSQVVRLLKDRALGAEFAEMNFSRFTAGETSLDQVLQACRDFPCFAERRVVLLQEAGRIKKKESKFLIEYLEAPAETTLLLITDAKLDGRLDWVKKLKKLSRWVELPALSNEDAHDWLLTAFRERDAKVQGEVIDAMVEALGPNLGILAQTVEQLITYVHAGEEITLERVQPFLTKVSEENIFEVIDAVFAGDYLHMNRRLDHLFQSGESPLKLLALLYRHLSILLTLKQGDESQARKVFRLPPFIVSRYQNQVRRYGKRLHLGLLKPLAVTDHALKHSGLPAERTLKQGLHDLGRQLG